MNTLISQLLEFIRSLDPAPGAASQALGDLLRAHAASVIQADPAQANIPPGDIDPIVVEAIRAGAEAAAVLRQSGTRMRLALEDLPLGTVAAEAGEQASEVFGPFIERSGRLLRFTAFRSGAFLRVAVRLLQANLPGEVFLLIPAASVPDAPDLQNWTLAPGSI